MAGSEVETAVVVRAMGEELNDDFRSRYPDYDVMRNATAPDWDAQTSAAVNADGRSHDIPNLWICDGSVFPTSTAVNPSLTIQASATRTAARIREMTARREVRI